LSSSRLASPEETASLQQLQSQLQCMWDESQHLPLLKRLWVGLHPDGEPFERESWRWKKTGFQGPNPATDLRGGGELALRNLVWFVEEQPEVSLPMMLKRRRPDNVFTEGSKNGAANLSQDEIFAHYPWAATGINVTRLLSELACFGGMTSRQQQAFHSARLSYWPLLTSESSFHECFTVVFRLLDKEWDKQNATYMQFPAVLAAVEKAVRAELESRAPPLTAALLSERLGLDGPLGRNAASTVTNR